MGSRRERVRPDQGGGAPRPGIGCHAHAFESHGADTFNMCEWGVIQRAEISEKAFRIGYLRPAVVTQAVLSFRGDIQEPHDLADLPVGVSAFSGQHYTTLQLLDGPLRRDQLHIVNVRAEVALEYAQAGELAATTVMEPFISLALKRGAHIVTSTFYRGGQVFARSVPEESWAAYVQGSERCGRRYTGHPAALPLVYY